MGGSICLLPVIVVIYSLLYGTAKWIGIAKIKITYSALLVYLGAIPIIGPLVMLIGMHLLSPNNTH